MFLQGIDDRELKQEFFKIALFSCIFKDFNKPASNKQELKLNNIFNELALYEENKDFVETIDVFTDEFEELKEKVGELVSDNEELTLKVLAENICIDFKENLEKSSVKVKKIIILELYIFIYSVVYSPEKVLEDYFSRLIDIDRGIKDEIERASKEYISTITKIEKLIDE